MAELKTKKNDVSVNDFLNSIEDGQKREDSFEVLEMMKKLSGKEPKMWGGSIVGFGNYQYKYETGREGEWFRVGFSPRKANLSLYIMDGFEKYDKLMGELGQHKTGKSCLYIKRLSDIDKKILQQLIKESLKSFDKKYGKDE